MGNPEGGLPNESTPLSRASKRSSPCRRTIRQLLLLAVVLTVTTTLLTTIFRGLKSASPTQPPKDMLPPKDNPVDPSGPYCPSATYSNPRATYNFPIGGDLTVLQTAYTQDGGYGGVQVDTVGEIRLRRLPKDSTHDDQAYFTVDVHVSDPTFVVEKSWDDQSRVLKVSTPNRVRANGNTRPCVSLEITAWFPEDAEFTNLLIEAIHLTLRVFEDISINISDRSKFTTINGQVTFPSTSLLDLENELSTSPAASDSLPLISSTSRGKLPFSSRRILVQTVTGSISGSYPLMDSLGLTSESGSIKVKVFPQDVLPSAPAPAELDVGTTSGSIQVNVPLRDGENPSYLPPARNYITRVHSRAGSIRGSFILGSTSTFEGTSGSMHLIGMPVIQEDENSPPNVFATHTISGSIRVQVLDPIFVKLLSSIDERPELEPHRDPYLPIGDDDPYLIIPPVTDNLLKVKDDPKSLKERRLRNLHSTHGSQSDSVFVQYPAAWEGNLHAATISGSLSAVGNDLDIYKEKNGYVSRELWARKGVDKDGDACSVEMTDIAGSLHFLVGPPM